MYVGSELYCNCSIQLKQDGGNDFKVQVLIILNMEF